MASPDGHNVSYVSVSNLMMSIMLTRLSGVISKDGDNKKCEDKGRHNEVCMENPDRNYGSSG